MTGKILTTSFSTHTLMAHLSLSSLNEPSRALTQTGFPETSRYDATTTTAVLSSVVSDLESDHVVKSNGSQIF